MTVRLLHYSDIENATDNPERIGRLTNCLRERRDDATLVCGTGDTIAPSALSMETGGEHVLPFFEAVTPDYSVIGNHDLDNGLDELGTIIDRSPQTWLAANLHEGDDLFADDRGVRSTAITSVEGASGPEQIGLVGVTDPVTLDGHVHAEELTVTDPVAAVEAVVPALVGDVDHVVVLSHAGHRDDEIARLDGVDLVLGGHDHERRNDVVDGTPVVHPGERGGLVSDTELAGDTPTVTLRDVTEYPAAGDVTSRYRDLSSELGLAETVAYVEGTVYRRRADLYPESAVGNFVADAFRWIAGADVAICHPGMLRSGPPIEGDVSSGAVRAISPFGNEIHSTTLDGEDLLALFERLGDPDSAHVSNEVFAHVSGARLSWRRTEEGLSLVDATVDGEAPTPERTYTVAAPSIEFGGSIWPDLAWDDIERDHGHQHDALVGYARERGIDAGGDGRLAAVEDTARGEFRSLR